MQGYQISKGNRRRHSPRLLGPDHKAYSTIIEGYRSLNFALTAGTGDNDC